MKVLKLTKKTKNKIELANLMLKIYCQLSDIKCPETELQIMSYFMVYGVRKSTKELIIRSQILKAKGSLENSMSTLRRIGLLIKVEDEGTKVIPQLDFTVDNTMGLIIKLENL